MRLEDMSRREFLKVPGVSSVGLGFGGLIPDPFERVPYRRREGAGDRRSRVGQVGLGGEDREELGQLAAGHFLQGVRLGKVLRDGRSALEREFWGFRGMGGHSNPSV